MLIVYKAWEGRSWQSVNYMVKLAAELFDAEVLLLNGGGPGFVAKLETVLGRRRGDEDCLVICPHPVDLNWIFRVPGWRKRFRSIAAWVIDSFWVEHIPRLIPHTRIYDRLFITTAEDVDDWNRITKIPTTWLPWGTDVLRCGSGETDRKWDLLRVGRQPSEWESDEETERACSAKGLEFHGRPGEAVDVDRAQQEFMHLHGQCKFMLAFSNATHSTNYTHPNREYVTARWVDALGSGTTVAGIAPRTRVVDELFWPGATLELGTTGREEGLKVIEEAVRAWTPRQATNNYRNALERLDWRWRFLKLAEAFGITSRPLDDEVRLLKEAIDRSGGPLEVSTRPDLPGHVTSP